jgi:hypothetical protein
MVVFETSAQKIIRVMEKKGYSVFKDGGLNIVGIRKDYNASNKFDDTMTAFYFTNDGWIFKKWPCTTDPGWAWLEEATQARGTAVLKEGQYSKSHKIGLHKGQYKALVQVGSLTVYRDVNRDHTLDKGKTETGLFGINIHRASPHTQSIQVDSWSAGCQVFANPDDFREFLAMADSQGVKTNWLFTYTLLSEQDLVQ